MTKKKILWLGSFQTDEQFKSMLKCDIGEASGFASQKGLVYGIDAIVSDEYTLDTIACSIAYPAYPLYPRKTVKRIQYSRTEGTKDISIGYLNLKYINYFARYISLQKEVRLWRKENCSEDINVIIYEPSIDKLDAAIYLKNKCNAKIYLIIPDIPELVCASASELKRYMKRKQAILLKDRFKKVDGFILYSEKMAEYYTIPRNKWILVEGVFDENEVGKFSSEKDVNDDSIVLMYSGILDPCRGIPELLKAFQKLEGNKYELWLTGGGRCEEEIKKYACADKRIKYYGFLASRDKVLELQGKADILIHTRDITAASAPYCFPSKLFEYLVSKKSVLSVRLPGIPNEYFQYLIPIEEMTADGILSAIRVALNEDPVDRKQRGEKAREFVLSEKNGRSQAKKILDFMGVKNDKE